MADESTNQPDPPVTEQAAAEGAGEASAPEAMAEDALRAAKVATDKLREQAAEGAVELPELTADASEETGGPGTLQFLDDVKLKVAVELGRTRMYVEDVLRLASDSIVELDKAAGDPVDIYVNDQHVARGEVLVLDESFCVRVSEILHNAATNEEED